MCYSECHGAHGRYLNVVACGPSLISCCMFCLPGMMSIDEALMSLQTFGRRVALGDGDYCLYTAVSRIVVIWKCNSNLQRI